MGGSLNPFLCIVLVIAGCAVQANAMTMVMGNVFCDQCLIGRRSLFDIPIYGAKVGVECRGDDGGITLSKEESTDMIGNFVMRFDGTPDLSGCAAQVIESPQDSNCKIAGSSAKPLDLSFRMFSMEVYTVDPLFFQPAKPMSFCPNSPPTGRPPNISVPPLPLIRASACPHEYWLKPEYRCYWRLLMPDTTVGVAFGEEAGKRYGRNMTLWEGLYGRGDLYRTLLREAIASLLNSYNSFQFQYNTLSVVAHMNSALQGSAHDALEQALHFKKANDGGGKIKCLLTPCK